MIIKSSVPVKAGIEKVVIDRRWDEEEQVVETPEA
jgi:hypothetical protein